MKSSRLLTIELSRKTNALNIRINTINRAWMLRIFWGMDKSRSHSKFRGDIWNKKRDMIKDNEIRISRITPVSGRNKCTWKRRRTQSSTTKILLQTCGMHPGRSMWHSNRTDFALYYYTTAAFCLRVLFAGKQKFITLLLTQATRFFREYLHQRAIRKTRSCRKHHQSNQIS